MVLVKLIEEGVRRHCRYFKERATWPVTAEKEGTVQEWDSHFSDLKLMVKNPLQKTITMTPWISDAT